MGQGWWGPTGPRGVPGAAEGDAEAGEDGAEPSRTTAPREHGREPACSRATSYSLPLRCVLYALVMPWKPILSLPSHSPSHPLLSSGHVCQSLCLPFLDLVLNLCYSVKDQQRDASVLKFCLWILKSALGYSQGGLGLAEQPQSLPLSLLFTNDKS